MPGASDEIRIRIITETKEAVRAIAAWTAGVGSAIMTAKKIYDVLNDLAEAFYESEKAQTKLTATLAATGNAIGYTKNQLNAMADELASVTALDDEAIVEAEALMLTYQNISRDTFPRVLKAAADLSTVLGTDLKSSVVQLGVALESPEEGMTRLRRAGVVFTEDQRAMVKQLQDSGDIIGAQNVILKALEDRVGGAAIAMGETAYGAAEKLKREFGNLKEEIGGVIAAGLKPLNNEMATFFSDMAKRVARWRKLTGIDGELTDLEKLQVKLEEVTDDMAIYQRMASGDVQRSDLGPMETRAGAIKRAQEELVSLQREQYSIAKQIAEATKGQVEEADRLIKEKQAEIELSEYLAKVNEEYAKTEAGKLDALQKQIAYWEEALKTAVATKPQVEAILAALRDQLPVQEDIAVATEDAWRSAVSMNDPFRNISQTMVVADDAALSMSDSFRNIAQTIQGESLASGVVEMGDAALAMSESFRNIHQDIEGSTYEFSQTGANLAFAAQDAKVLADQLAASEKATKDLSEAMSTVSSVAGAAADIVNGDMEGGIRSLIGMMGPWGSALLGVYDLVEAIANAFGDARDSADSLSVKIAGDLSNGLAGVKDQMEALGDAFDALEGLADSITDTLADAILSGDWSDVEEALRSQINQVIVQAALQSAGVADAAAALGEALQAWLTDQTGDNWSAVQAAYDAILAAGESAAGIYDALSTGQPPPALAAGGVVTRPTMALLGESGPEAVVPLDRMSGMGTTIIVQGSLIHERDLDSRVYAAMHAKQGGY